MRPSLPAPVPVLVALIALTAAVALMAPDATRAQEEEPNALGARCRKAVDELCPDSRPGSVERRACVRGKTDQLPEECRAAMRRNLPPGAEALIKACESDIDAHCGGTRRGGGRLVRCLQAVDDEKLSGSCKEQLATLGTRGPAKAPRAAPKAPDAE